MLCVCVLMAGISLASCDSPRFQLETYYVKLNYDKTEVDIPMRDGVKLHTVIYSPKDDSKPYPILLQRTCYSAGPYGALKTKPTVGPNTTMMKEGGIMVYQDVRGRWMSEGVFDNMRPYIPNKTGKQTDESSDTYDTIDWLVKNVENNNGNVGIWGISYPGFYSSCSLLDSHPALKAVSPQACIGDFFFDDFHHNGAYLESYWFVTPLFGHMKTEPTDKAWYKFPEIGTKDAYSFFLERKELTQLDSFFEPDNIFWDQLKDHPNYDEFWQKRGLIQHLKKEKVKPAVMVVGGLFDAEDLYGPFETYKSIEKNSDTYNTMVFGPWSHGDWARSSGRQVVGNVYFGDSISKHYQENIETKFFNHFLKDNGKGESGLPEAYMYDSGTKVWKEYAQWPPKGVQKQTYYLGKDKKLATEADNAFSQEFVSDPDNPVPSEEEYTLTITPRSYMTGNQKFASERPDVLVFETEVLTEDMTLAGEINSVLQVATTGTDADWVVKVIDVFPEDTEEQQETSPKKSMADYHMMVRSEVMRGRFRNDMSKPEPFEPGKKTKIALKLQDVHHTFRKGHRLQVQVQSTWFPLIDRNPQTFVPNIFKAKDSDYQKQTHTVFGDSSVEFTVLPK